MPNTTRQVLVEDFYATTITGSNVPSTGDFTVTLATPPINPKGWLIFSPADAGLRERCYYHSVSGSTVSVYGINRYTAKAHLTWASVQINDVSNIFNYLSEISSSTFYIEKTGGLWVTVWGWPFLRDNLTISVGDTNLTLTKNATNYVYYKWSTNEIKNNVTESLAIADDGIVVSEVICASSLVTSVAPRNHKMCTFTISTWPTWAQWTPWTIATAPTWVAQTVNDNLVPAWTTTITNSWTDPLTWIKVARADLSYTYYTTSGISEFDSTGNLLTTQTIVWVGWAQVITYATINGTVDKDTWVFSFDWEIAYTNISNTFKEPNTFEKDVSFKWLTLFPYKEWGDNVSLFDWTYGSKQKFTFTDSWSHTLSFQHLRAGWTYTFAINVTWGSATLNKATSFVDCDTITTQYELWTTNFPLTLPVWVHFFAAEAFSTAIHIAYTTSQASA